MRNKLWTANGLMWIAHIKSMLDSGATGGKCQLPSCPLCQLNKGTIDRTDLADWELSVEVQLARAVV